MPKRGTPHYMVGDQLHHIFKGRVHKRMEWLIGHEKDLTCLDFLCDLFHRGGIFVSAAGVQRCPPLFLFCLAVAIERSLFPQYLVTAAFCKCGLYDKAECHKLFEATTDLAKGELEALANAPELLLAEQNKLVGVHIWQNPAHSSLGHPKQLHFQSWGNLQKLPLRVDPSLLQKALDFRKEEEANNAKLLLLEPESLGQMRELEGQPKITKEQLATEIVPRKKGTAHGVLSQFGQCPDSTNVGNLANFRPAFLFIFAKTQVFKQHIKTDTFKNFVADFQLFVLKKRYMALQDYLECTGRPVGLTHTCSRFSRSNLPWSYLTKMHSLSWIKTAWPWRRSAYTNSFGKFFTWFGAFPTTR